MSNGPASACWEAPIACLLSWVTPCSAGTIKWRMAHPPDHQRSALQGLAYAGGIGGWAGGRAGIAGQKRLRLARELRHG